MTVMGIEKILPEWRDLEVFLQLLPRSSTAERMNPYTSLWTGVRPGDGPQEFHLILLDGGRTNVLADEVGPAGAALHPLLGVPERVPGLLAGRRAGVRVGLSRPDRGRAVTAAVRARQHPTLPWASSLCGACYDACPVKIEIPSLLVHLRGRVVREQKSRFTPSGRRWRRSASVFASRPRYERAQKLARLGRGPLGEGDAAGLDGDARASRPAEGDVPGVVA